MSPARALNRISRSDARFNSLLPPMIGGAAQQPPMTPPPPWFPPRVAPSPPAPPPFQWSCSCFNVSDDQIDANFTCGGELHMRAYLSCNGIPYKSWKSLGSCNHATGCGEAGCNPPWDRNYNYALLVSSYRPQHCLILPPSPPLPPQSPQPPAAPYPFWCERQQVETWNSQGHQPANTITSLSAVAFGIYGFTSTNAKDAHYRICCATLILTGLGSAAHHWWRRGFEWQDKEVDTHALDWVAMLMLCSAALSYAINVLLAVLLRPPGGAAPLASLQTLRRVQSASLLACFGAAWFATSAFNFRHYVIIAFMFTAIAAHGILFLALALRLRAGQCVDKDRLRCVAYAYAAAVVLIIVAVPSLVVEWSSCPPWLFRSGMSLHGVWHVAGTRASLPPPCIFAGGKY